MHALAVSRLTGVEHNVLEITRFVVALHVGLTDFQPDIWINIGDRHSAYGNTGQLPTLRRRQTCTQSFPISETFATPLKTSLQPEYCRLIKYKSLFPVRQPITYPVQNAKLEMGKNPHCSGSVLFVFFSFFLHLSSSSVRFFESWGSSSVRVRFYSHL